MVCMVFPVRSRKKRQQETKVNCIHSFHSFIYSLPPQQDRMLPELKPKNIHLEAVREDVMKMCLL